jgi:hypothetical protein
MFRAEVVETNETHFYIYQFPARYTYCFEIIKLNLVLYSVLRNGRTRHSVVGVATGYGLDDRGVGVRVPVGSRIFSTSSRPTLGSTQPPIQWVPGLFLRGESGRAMKLTTELRLVPRSRKCGYIHPLPPTPSWLSA